jgi:signal transduction histidine kinase
VSQQTVVRDELANEAALRSLLPIGISLPIAWLTVWLVIGRLLHPLGVMAKRISRRAPHDLQPIGSGELPREIFPFVEAVNAAILRQSQALAAQRRFVADAAHALRTPLTALQLQLDNLSRALGDESREEVKNRIGVLKSGLRRAAQLSSQLLRLARAQRNEASGQKLVELGPLARDSLAELLPLADQRRQDLGLTRCDIVSVAGDAAELRVMVDSLIDNALRYTPKGGTVDVAVISGESDIRLEIADTGPGIPNSEISRVLQPFQRGGRPSIDGSGLGLTIASTIAERHGARLTLANRCGGKGLLAKVTFPIALK